MSGTYTRGGAARSADVRSATRNPSCPEKTAKAFRIVLAYTVADAFALTVEESLWVRHHLANAFAPLEKLTPEQIPLSVRKELLEGVYTKATEMSDMSEIGAMPLMEDGVTSSASVDEWTGVLMETITSCYRMRPMHESILYGQIHGLLTELGVGNPENPRASRYLPNAVKARLAS